MIGSAFTILHSRHLAPTDRFGILVGEGVANALKLRIGDRVNLLLNTREGAMNALDFEVSGVFRSISREYDAQAVRVMLGAAQELTATDGVGSIVVLLRDTALTEAAAATLRRHLPSGLEVKTWLDLAEFYTSTAAL